MTTLLGLLSLLCTIAAFAVYLHDTFKKGVRPHVMTWLAFGGFTTVGWLIQVQKGAGPGGWALGLTSAGCLIVSGASLGKQIQEHEKWWWFPRIDWIWLAISVAIFCLYLRFPNHPTVAAILTTLADLAAYGPTIDQGWRNPYRDCIPAFFLNSVKFIPVLLALLVLQVFSIATALYPASLFAMNLFVAWLLRHRRRQFTRAEEQKSRGATL